MIRPGVALLCAIALLASCSSTAVKDERAAALNATGSASIENWRSPLMKTTRVFVLQIDGQLSQAAGQRGVFALSPGKHSFQVHCHFTRLMPQLIIDAGMVNVTLEAEPGTRYRVRAEKTGEFTAEVWVEVVATGGLAVPRTRVELNANPQDVPTAVVLPI